MLINKSCDCKRHIIQHLPLNRFLTLCEDLPMPTTYPAESVEATIATKIKWN